MSNILEVQNVVKQYGDYTALNNVSLQVPSGSIYGLLGPNGAGKTSLIRIINQITMPDSGEIILDGEKLNPKHIQHIGYLPEERGLYSSMKVGEQCLHVKLGLPFHRLRYVTLQKRYFDRCALSLGPRNLLQSVAANK